MNRVIAVVLSLLALSACAAGISRTFSYSEHEPSAMLLFDVPSMVPLPSDFAERHQLSSAIWGPNAVYLVPLNNAGGHEAELRVGLTQDNRLLTRNRSLMSFDAVVREAGSIFAPLRLPPGRYAVTRVVGQVNMNPTSYVDLITYCALSDAPVIQVTSGTISVLDLAEVIQAPNPQGLWPRDGHSSSVERARTLLAEYPNMSSPLSAVHFDGRIALGARTSGFWDSENACLVGAS